MDKETFIKHINKIRNCDAALLDNAIQKGVYKARHDRVDPRNLLRLSAACLVTATLCVALNLAPIKAATQKFLSSNGLITPESAEVFADYVNGFTNSIIKHLGG